jgi:GNAT superfamily N-acetyltransferase
MPATNVEVGFVEGDDDLEQILVLQKRNLAFSTDGFVTIDHTLEMLRAFHAVMPSVVARHRGNVVGYALSMRREASALVPLLEPMFGRLDSLEILAGRRWYVMGQICIDDEWRGRGLLDKLYEEHRNRYAASFDWLVTEIAMRNPRSLRAHTRAGFVEIDRYVDDTDDWSVVGLCFSTSGPGILSQTWECNG